MVFKEYNLVPENQVVPGNNCAQEKVKTVDSKIK
jgi:hypothetical protein